MSTPTTSTAANTVVRARDRVGTLLQSAEERAGLLWASVLLALALDTALTAYGLRIGLTEGNPVVRGLIVAYGAPTALLATKAAVLLVGLAAWRALPTGRRAVVPIGLSLPWWGAVAVNVVAVSTV
jgi:hypothetical protein